MNITLPAGASSVALAGAVVTVLVWALKQFWNIDVPPLIQGSFTVIATTVAAIFIKDAPTPAQVAKFLVSKK